MHFKTFALHKRRHHPQHVSAQLGEQASLLGLHQRYLVALLESLLEILLDPVDLWIIIDEYTAFKMQVETSVIQIDGPRLHSGLCIPQKGGP